ncbi:MAG: ASPIC/UnbV domain-containing protein, partial [Vicinamibacterales bacterium]
RQGARFDEVPAATGSGLAAVLPARGAAFGDLDHDGRVDVVINNHDQRPTLLRNVAPAGHWISISLHGDDGIPRDAIGAVVTVEAGSRRMRRDVVSGASYCSQSDLRAHFGLGQANKIDRLVVRWPDGTREAYVAPGVDRIVHLTRGRGQREKP